MTAPRDAEEVRNEQVAMARDAVQQAIATNDAQQQQARQFLDAGTATSSPTTPAHTD